MGLERLNLSQYALRNRYKEFGKRWVEEAIKIILETGDNTHIYKRKEYANGKIRHRKNTNMQQQVYCLVLIIVKTR